MRKPTAKKGWCLASEYEEDQKLYYVLPIASFFVYIRSFRCHGNSMKQCVGLEPPRRSQDKIKHGRHLLGEMCLRENEKRGEGKRAYLTLSKGEKKAKMVRLTSLNCSTVVRKVWKVGRVLVSNLLIKGDSCLSCLVLDLRQPHLGGGNGNPLQYSCLENPMDRGAWQAAVHGVTKSQTRLSDFTFTSHFHALEKEMATRSSVLAWRIPGTGEPGGLPSMGSHRVGHN